MTYTPDKIMNIIKYYHININNLREMERGMRSVGVSQYGEEASMPKGNNISSVVENEVMRQIENTKFWADTITDIKYLQDRWDRITDEQEAQILSLRLDGYSVHDIAKIVRMTRSGVYRKLERIAYRLSYPQDEATNSTNYEYANSI